MHCRESISVKLDTIKGHLTSGKHIRNKSTGAGVIVRTPDATEPINVTAEKEDFAIDLVRMMAEANIPLARLPKLKPFLMRHCQNGGCTPDVSHARKKWLPEAFRRHMMVVKNFLEGKEVYVLFDESTDERNISFLEVFIGWCEYIILIEVKRMEACNNQTVTHAVLDTIESVGIPRRNVIAFVSDSTAYCELAVKKNLLDLAKPGAVWCPCMAHILALVADELVDINPNVERFIALFQGLLTKQVARRRRLSEHLRDLPPGQRGLPPKYRPSRWRTLFDVVVYHVVCLWNAW